MIYDIEPFRNWLLDNEEYTTEDMELVLRALSEWRNLQLVSNRKI